MGSKDDSAWHCVTQHGPTHAQANGRGPHHDRQPMKFQRAHDGKEPASRESGQHTSLQDPRRALPPDGKVRIHEPLDVRRPREFCAQNADQLAANEMKGARETGGNEGSGGSEDVRSAQAGGSEHSGGSEGEGSLTRCARVKTREARSF